MKKGIILDVDGTLWDACRAIADSWNEYLRRFAPGIQTAVTEETIRRACGRPMNEFAALVFPGESPEEGEKLVRGCCRYEVEYMRTRGGVPYPGLKDTLRALKGAYHLYIVSNCQEGYIEDFLSCTGTAEYIEDTECYGRTLLPKAENIRRLFARNDLDAAFYLGDTQGDHDSAIEAGIDFCLAAYGFGEVKEETMRIRQLRDLAEAAKTILG